MGKLFENRLLKNYMYNGSVCRVMCKHMFTPWHVEPGSGSTTQGPISSMFNSPLPQNIHREKGKPMSAQFIQGQSDIGFPFFSVYILGSQAMYITWVWIYYYLRVFFNSKFKHKGCNCLWLGSCRVQQRMILAPVGHDWDITVLHWKMQFDSQMSNVAHGTLELLFGFYVKVTAFTPCFL